MQCGEKKEKKEITLPLLSTLLELIYQYSMKLLWQGQ